MKAPVHIHDMHATLMHLCGVNHDAHDYAERLPRRSQELWEAIGLSNVQLGF